MSATSNNRSVTFAAIAGVTAGSGRRWFTGRGDIKVADFG
jgi:hypothetical protein